MNNPNYERIQKTYLAIKTSIPSDVITKFFKENSVKGGDTQDQIIDEFCKFIALAAHSSSPIAMTSKVIDELWHTLIIFTDKYEAFCKKFIGRFLHHSPNTDESPVGVAHVKNFQLMYEKTFGIIPDIWEIEKAKLCGGYGCAGGCNCK